MRLRAPRAHRRQMPKMNGSDKHKRELFFSEIPKPSRKVSIPTSTRRTFRPELTAARGRAWNFSRRGSSMNISRILKVMVVALVVTALGISVSGAFAQGSHTSSQFQGPKANKGTVTHSTKDGKSVLTLSDDFVVPDTPDPHWQVVDSDGNVYQLDKLKTKAFVGTNYKKEIVVPKYVKNVAKVQIWCAFAEVNLGEASFSSPVM